MQQPGSDGCGCSSQQQDFSSQDVSGLGWDADVLSRDVGNFWRSRSTLPLPARFQHIGREGLWPGEPECISCGLSRLQHLLRHTFETPSHHLQFLLHSQQHIPTIILWFNISSFLGLSPRCFHTAGCFSSSFSVVPLSLSLSSVLCVAHQTLHTHQQKHQHSSMMLPPPPAALP